MYIPVYCALNTLTNVEMQDAHRCIFEGLQSRVKRAKSFLTLIRTKKIRGEILQICFPSL